MPDKGKKKMLNQLIKPNSGFILAISGGVDSMALFDFYSKGKTKFTPVFFHHNTKTSDEAEKFLRQHVSNLVVGYLEKDCPKGKSKEDFWRQERYDFLKSFNKTIVTAHHLDDAVETWLFSCMHGNPKLIPHKNGLVIRPFLTTRKSEFKSWCERKSVPWVEDQTNSDDKYMRNYIRNNIIDKALVVNPGIHSVVRKKIIASLQL
jgi:tRNA(Ile)-lysidine synthetase-like protein